MSSSNDLDLNKKKSSNSDNGFGKLFENTVDKKEKSIIEKDSDSDDIIKKFGSDKGITNKSNNNNDSLDEDDNLQLNIMEDNENEKFSIGKYLD